MGRDGIFDGVQPEPRRSTSSLRRCAIAANAAGRGIRMAILNIWRTGSSITPDALSPPSDTLSNLIGSAATDLDTRVVKSWIWQEELARKDKTSACVQSILEVSKTSEVKAGICGNQFEMSKNWQLERFAVLCRVLSKENLHNRTTQQTRNLEYAGHVAVVEEPTIEEGLEMSELYDSETWLAPSSVKSIISQVSRERLLSPLGGTGYTSAMREIPSGELPERWRWRSSNSGPVHRYPPPAGANLA
ncbi:hypothetical protein GALMADRAFT_281876 [Galerina marginata CBS 339.88]|uniref:Uncharacterized protein n=1 Tax=Galerina marginata (strain CBS 339.88) TaxID=685588 RepID=A0A067SJZ8_GALM3|nr:hypothetical protein GALMADRAFT_281876 [Galerina marginata CBS 339.88]